MCSHALTCDPLDLESASSRLTESLTLRRLSLSARDPIPNVRTLSDTWALRAFVACLHHMCSVGIAVRACVLSNKYGLLLPTTLPGHHAQPLPFPPAAALPPLPPPLAPGLAALSLAPKRGNELWNAEHVCEKYNEIKSPPQLPHL